MSSLFSPSATGGSTKGKTTQLWKLHDTAANKSGPHGTVYWVSKAKDKSDPKKVGDYKVSSTYSGDWLHNKRDGYGTLTMPSGNKYEGEWKMNKRHGRGTQWVKVNGKLKKRYTGFWKNNKQEGKGIMFYDNGDKYEGDWKEGKRNGKGKQVYANGDVYDGEWENDQRSGLGMLLLANGDCYEGHWYNDMKEGPGRLFFMSTRKMYEGEWAEDIARCGVLSDMPAEYVPDEEDRVLMGLNGKSVAEPSAKEDVFNLPGLRLKEPDAVVTEAIGKVRRSRIGTASGSQSPVQKMPLGMTEEGFLIERDGEREEEEAKAQVEGVDLSQEELEQLRDAFRTVDATNTGKILGDKLAVVLAELGIAPSEEDLGILLEEMGASRSSYISFSTFATTMARLRE